MTEPSFLTATRTAYDTIAVDYAAQFSDELPDLPLERGFLAAFAEFVKVTGHPAVADVGCGPGHITAYLSSLGLDLVGVDLSPRMIDVAKQAYPGLRFEVGSMTHLDLPDGGLGGLVAMYSTIHVPTEQLPVVFAEFRRVLALGGHLLLAFQKGEDEPGHRDEAFGHQISLDFHMRRPESVVALLAEAGLAMTAQLVREPVGEHESAPRAYLLARKQTG